MRSLLDINKTLYFIFLCLLTWLLLFVKKAFIEYETTAFLILEEQGQLGFFKIISTLQYFSVPVVYLFKFTVTTFLVWIGSFLFGYRLTFKTLFGIVIIAETIFLLPEIIKIGWFFTRSAEYNYFDIRAFYPLSVMNLFDHRELAEKFHYPAKALNVFEILYWFLLVHLIHIRAGKRLDVAYGIVFSSYTLFFLLWLWFYISVYK